MMASADSPSEKPGHWARQRGCAFSEACKCCRESTDSVERALKRQLDAALTTCGTVGETAHRVVTSFSGDMKGLMQILGHAGPNATFFCIFCMARLNQTNVAGVPHLRELPEEWKSRDQRTAEIVNPPSRIGTDEMTELAKKYAADSATNKGLSSGEYASCALEPLVSSDKLILHFSGTPLHIILGLGTNHLKMIRDECLKFDEQIALCVSDFESLEAYYAADAELTEAKATEEAQRLEAESKAAGMEICLSHDKKADRKGSASETKDEHAWVMKYRALKKEKEAAEKRVAEAVRAAAAAEKKLVQVRELLSSQVPGGPFITRYETFLTSLSISMAKYFGGTFIGPDLDKIFSSLERIGDLCAVLKSGSFPCPDGRTRTFGSDARAAEVESVLTPLSAAYRLFSRREAPCEHEIAAFPTFLREYAIAVAKVYPQLQPTPKMHVLTYHLEEIMQLKGSVGMDTEQGIELYHPEINYIRNMFRSMDSKPEQQLAAIADQCYARGAGKRERGNAPPLRAAKHARAEKARVVHKLKNT
jgi:hypothetical protein